jgi:hypothetical protein
MKPRNPSRPGPPSASSRSGSTADRRRHTRTPCERQATITQVDPNGVLGGRWPARVVNMTETAVGLRTQRNLLPGVGLLIQLPKGAEGQCTVLFGIILSSRTMPTGGYALGVVLQKPPASLIMSPPRPEPYELS